MKVGMYSFASLFAADGIFGLRGWVPAGGMLKTVEEAGTAEEKFVALEGGGRDVV